MPLSQLLERVETLAVLLQDYFGKEGVILWEGSSRVGGGSLPTAELPTVLLSLQVPHLESSELARRLRCGDPPVMVRLQQERLLLDLRTVNPEQDGLLLKAILAAVGMDGPEK
jgi:L-seryl-tRNA(Ser) seleniumtransferase